MMNDLCLRQDMRDGLASLEQITSLENICSRLTKHQDGNQ